MSEHGLGAAYRRHRERSAATGGGGYTNIIGESIALIIDQLLKLRSDTNQIATLLHLEADDRAKQRRYMRFNLVQDITEWERRVVEDDDTLHAEGMLLRLREELEMLDDLWPDTAAVALTAVQR